MATPDKLVFTLADVAKMTGFSESSIRRGCGAGRYKYTYFGKKYLMTMAQIEAMIATHERGGNATPVDEDDDLEAARKATLNSLRRGAA